MAALADFWMTSSLTTTDGPHIFASFSHDELKSRDKPQKMSTIAAIETRIVAQIVLSIHNHIYRECSFPKWMYNSINISMWSHENTDEVILTADGDLRTA